MKCPNCGYEILLDLKAAKQHMVLAALRRHRWHQGNAAAELNIAVRTLRTYIRKLRDAGWEIPAWVGQWAPPEDAEAS